MGWNFQTGKFVYYADNFNNKNSRFVSEVPSQNFLHKSDFETVANIIKSLTIGHFRCMFRKAL